MSEIIISMTRISDPELPPKALLQPFHFERQSLQGNLEIERVTNAMVCQAIWIFLLLSRLVLAHMMCRACIPLENLLAPGYGIAVSVDVMYVEDTCVKLSF